MVIVPVVFVGVVVAPVVALGVVVVEGAVEGVEEDSGAGVVLVEVTTGAALPVDDVPVVLPVFERVFDFVRVDFMLCVERTRCFVGADTAWATDADPGLVR